MRFHSALLGACLLSAAFVGAPNFTSVSFAQDADAAQEEKAEPYKLDESIFDVKDNQNGEYYAKAEKTLREEMSKFIDSKPEQAKLIDSFGKANAALGAIYRNLATADDIEPAMRARGIVAYGGSLADDSKVDELKALIEKYQSSEEEAVKNAVASLEGKLRFAELVGNEVKMEGVYLDGSEIKWEEYRGKVVLLDFWATWCGPCVGEVPNVKAMYEKYHEAGFEVLGYSLDQDLDALKKFEEEKKLPWKTASRKMSMDAEKDYVNMTQYYGINAIPTMILVDKEGKAIDTNARGQHLQELLKGLFPDVE